MVMRTDIDVANRTNTNHELPKKLSSSILHMQQTIDDLLIITKLQSQNNIEKTILSLKDLIQESITDLQKKHTGDTHTFTIL
jgi:signal transduction histidine kinase